MDAPYVACGLLTQWTSGGRPADARVLGSQGRQPFATRDVPDHSVQLRAFSFGPFSSSCEACSQGATPERDVETRPIVPTRFMSRRRQVVIVSDRLVC